MRRRSLGVFAQLKQIREETKTGAKLNLWRRVHVRDSPATTVDSEPTTICDGSHLRCTFAYSHEAAGRLFDSTGVGCAIWALASAPSRKGIRRPTVSARRLGDTGQI